MYPAVSHIDRVTDVPPPLVACATIHPLGWIVNPDDMGCINLYPQARDVFVKLEDDNVFTGELNVFRDIEAQRVCVVSDPRRKTDVRPMDETTATRLVRETRAYTYKIDGQPAAGVMATDVPRDYIQQKSANDPLTVDYTSLLMHLWTSVQHLHRRMDDVARVVEERKVQPDPMAYVHRPLCSGGSSSAASSFRPAPSLPLRRMTGDDDDRGSGGGAGMAVACGLTVVLTVGILLYVLAGARPRDVVGTDRRDDFDRFLVENLVPEEEDGVPASWRASAPPVPAPVAAPTGFPSALVPMMVHSL